MEENNGCGQQSIIFMVITIVFVLLVFLTVMLVSLGILTLGGGGEAEAHSIEESAPETDEAEFTIEEEATEEPGQ